MKMASRLTRHVANELARRGRHRDRPPWRGWRRNERIGDCLAQLRHARTGDGGDVSRGWYNGPIPAAGKIDLVDDGQMADEIVRRPGRRRRTIADPYREVGLCSRVSGPADACGFDRLGRGADA